MGHPDRVQTVQFLLNFVLGLKIIWNSTFHKSCLFPCCCSDCCRNNPVCSQVAAEIAAPLSQAKKITMVSDGSGEVGAARITGEVLDIMVKVPTMVNKMTGVDVTNVSN